jgi:hypothetical protein
MVKKYVIYRVPVEADKGFRAKKEKMEKRIKAWTGKDVRIPMTKVLRAVALNPVDIGEEQVIKLVRKKKVKRCEA